VIFRCALWSATVGFTPPPPGWIPGATFSLLVARLFGKGLVSRFERVSVRSDIEKRISRDSYVAINPSQIVQLDDCLTGDKITLWVDDLPVYLSPD